MMKVIYRILFWSVLLMWYSNSTWAQWDTTWTQTYGGNRNDIAKDIVVSLDNGFLLIGSTGSFGFDNSQMYFLKIDSVGNIMWSKSHGGDGQEWGESVIQTSDGGFLGVGYTNSWGEGGYDIFLVKLDANGSLEYEYAYGGFDWDFAYDVIEVAPGKFVIAGETHSFGEKNGDGWLLQFDEQTRTFDWETTVGVGKEERLKAVTQGPLNTLFAVGGGIPVNRSDTDIFVVQFDAQGSVLAKHFYGDTLLDFGNDIVALSDGNFAITGTRQYAGQAPGVAVLKIDNQGAVIFDTNWSASAFEYGEGMHVFEMSNNRVGVSGTIRKYVGNDDMYLAYSLPSSKLFQTGNTHGSNFVEWGYSSAYLGSQGFLIVGKTNGYETFFENVVAVKTDTMVQLDNPSWYKNNSDTLNITGIHISGWEKVGIQYNSRTYSFYIEGIEKGEFRVIDLLGREIVAGEFVNAISIREKGLKPGTYILQLFSESNVWSTVFVTL